MTKEPYDNGPLYSQGSYGPLFVRRKSPSGENRVPFRGNALVRIQGEGSDRRWGCWGWQSSWCHLRWWIQCLRQHTPYPGRACDSWRPAAAQTYPAHQRSRRFLGPKILGLEILGLEILNRKLSDCSSKVNIHNGYTIAPTLANQPKQDKQYTTYMYRLRSKELLALVKARRFTLFINRPMMHTG